MSGEVAYTECDDDSGPCPFYLASLEAASSKAVTLSATCDDGSTDRITLDNLVLALSQPTFGVEEGGTQSIGFPAAGLILDTAFDATQSEAREASHLRVRRPTRDAIVISVDGATFQARDLRVVFELPCGRDSKTQVSALVDLLDPGDGSQLAYAPEVDISVPATVTCGAVVPLTASVSDRDADVESERWFVDDVLMSNSLASMSFTEDHQLKLVVRDSRGATTTAVKDVQCN